MSSSWLDANPALYCFERPLPYRADTSGSGCQFAQFTGWSFADFIGLIRHDDFLAFSVLANSTPRSNGEPAISSTEMNTHEWFQCVLPMPRNNVVLPVPPLSSMMNTWTFRVGATDSNNAIMASACSLSLSLTECILHKLDALINNHLAWLFRLPVPMHCLTMACVQWNHSANVLWDYHQRQGHWPWFESHVIWFHASVSSVLWFPFREWHVHNGIIKLTASAVIAESLNSIEWRILSAPIILAVQGNIELLTASRNVP